MIGLLKSVHFRNLGVTDKKGDYSPSSAQLPNYDERMIEEE